MDFAELKAQTDLGVRTVRVCLDRSLNDEHARLNDELVAEEKRVASTLADGARSRELAEQILELEDRMSERQVPLRFKPLSNRAFRRLVAQHQPRDKNAEDARNGYNSDTFPPAVVSACAVDPVLSVEQADELLFDLLTHGDAEAVVDTVLRDSVIASSVPFSRIASQVMSDAEKSSEPLASGE